MYKASTAPPGETARTDPGFAQWVQEELEKVSQSFSAFEGVRLVETFIAPSKPRTGDVRLADGTSWNPGAGAGFYGYYGGAWVKLG